jgi:hypothetical protein
MGIFIGLQKVELSDKFPILYTCLFIYIYLYASSLRSIKS